MANPTELDQAFKKAMAEATAAKAELISTMLQPIDDAKMVLVFKGLRLVRTARRTMINKYRELKPHDTDAQP